MDKEEIKHKIEEAGEKAKHTLEEAGEKAREAGGRAREKLGHAGEEAREKLGEAGAKAGETARRLKGMAAGEFRKLADSPALRSIGPLTWSGLAVALLFLLFMFIDGVNLRWWVMLPLGSAGLGLLGWSWVASTDRKGLDARLCMAGFVALALLMLWRDGMLSQALLEKGRAAREIKDLLK